MITPTDPCRVFRKLAQANRLANHRLHAACARLSPDDYAAPRTSFFPSIRATLNHILMVDRFYITALEGGPLDMAALHEATGMQTLADVTAAQEAADARLLALVCHAGGGGPWPRGGSGPWRPRAA